MEQAVASFFGLKLAEAAERLDQAYLAASDLPEEKRSFWSTANQYSVDFESSCVDSMQRILRFRLVKVYRNTDTLASPDENSAKSLLPMAGFPGTLRLELLGKDGKRVAEGAWPELECWQDPKDAKQTEGDISNNAASAWCEWHLPEVEPGCFRVHAVCVLDSQEADLIAESIAVLDGLPMRIRHIESWAEENRRSQRTTQHATARWLAKELIQASRFQASEIDLPWCQWFRDFEYLQETNHVASKWLESSGPGGEHDSIGLGSRWVVLNRDNQNQIVRLEVPSMKKGPFPVVFAFHGAGGSENMFFESYGAGRLIELARERSWLVVCPRQTLGGLNMDIDQMLQSLQEILPIDSDRVALVGHSMGAAQAISQVSIHPDKVHAVAALGGGGNARHSDTLTHVPFFVAAGDRDFGRSRARALADQLDAMKARVEYREYSNVEHMVIVQAALDDVFHFLDRSLSP